MTFGLTIEKLLLIGFLAAMFIGPTRLPAYAAAIARFVKETKVFALAKRDLVQEAFGPDAADIDWRTLDPRQYDPRRIIREALLEDDGEPASKALNTPPPATQDPDPPQSEVHR